MDILETLKADYARFPADQTYDIYDEQVYFKDPLNEFTGIKRYQQNIALIARLFSNIQLDLYEITQTDSQITTRWTLHMDAPLPWKPRLSIPGWSELGLNSVKAIASHIDYWDIPPGAVLAQCAPWRSQNS
ncbi:MAG: DUF2358 domain-containing protein [Cyanobacteria bacterium P01_H01_bin.15]